MAAPIVQAAAIGAGANLLGGALTNSKQVDPSTSYAWWWDRGEARRVRKEEYQRQKEFAKHGVRWRVQDAKAAGLHPLFAFSGQLGGYSPSATVLGGGSGGYSESDAMGEALSRAGQDVSRAVLAQETAEQTEARIAALEGVKARARLSGIEADMAEIQLAKMRQEFNASKPHPSGEGGYSGGVPGGPFFDQRQAKPSEVVSASSHDWSREAGTSPHWKTYTFEHSGPDGDPMMIDLPAGSGPSEAYESMAESKVILWMVVERNMRKYGPQWLGQFYENAAHLFK